MRSYGKQIIRRRVEQMQDGRIESRDAVITAIDFATRAVTVRIQGSDKNIIAGWALSFSRAPEWLKVGNAVRVAHPEGRSGRIEIVGHGIYVPTTTGGGSMPAPPISILDGVVSGCSVMAEYPVPTMTVSIAIGVYRIANILYTLGGIVMGSGLGLMGSGVVMGAVASAVTLDAASTTKARYDLLVVGVDGVIDVVKGTEALADPVMPTVPANHIKLAHILVHANMTEVEGLDINAYWTTPVVSSIGFAFGTLPLHGYSIANPHFDATCTIAVTVQDQYGNPLTKVFPGHPVKFGFLMGNGSIVCDGTTFDESSGEQVFYTTSGVLSMVYTRKGTCIPEAYGNYLGNGEHSAYFYASVFATVLTERNSAMLQLWDDTDTEIQPV